MMTPLPPLLLLSLLLSAEAGFLFKNLGCSVREKNTGQPTGFASVDPHWHCPPKTVTSSQQPVPVSQVAPPSSEVPVGASHRPSVGPQRVTLVDYFYTYNPQHIKQLGKVILTMDVQQGTAAIPQLGMPPNQFHEAHRGRFFSLPNIVPSNQGRDLLAWFKVPRIGKFLWDHASFPAVAQLALFALERHRVDGVVVLLPQIVYESGMDMAWPPEQVKAVATWWMELTPQQADMSKFVCEAACVAAMIGTYTSHGAVNLAWSDLKNKRALLDRVHKGIYAQMEAPLTETASIVAKFDDQKIRKNQSLIYYLLKMWMARQHNFVHENVAVIFETLLWIPRWQDVVLLMAVIPRKVDWSLHADKMVVDVLRYYRSTAGHFTPAQEKALEDIFPFQSTGYHLVKKYLNKARDSLGNPSV